MGYGKLLWQIIGFGPAVWFDAPVSHEGVGHENNSMMSTFLGAKTFFPVPGAGILITIP